MIVPSGIPVDTDGGAPAFDNEAMLLSEPDEITDPPWRAARAGTGPATATAPRDADAPAMAMSPP
jgi:hypothetical protein